jgi:NAD(P)-dependent dehydrogenase (short-subunit alcohol dehydrogenase family)
MEQVLITGANRGIGLELCRQFQARGAEVIGVCRKSSAALDELGVEVRSGVDVSSDEEVASLASALSDKKLDILVNCAGILQQESLDNLDFDSVRRQFEVNSMGPLRVTAALRSLLQEGSKVAIVTSRMGSIADNDSGGAYGYRMSKAAVNAAGTSLAVDLKPSGVAVCLLHPGFVRTDMTGGNGLVDANESAAGLIARIDGLNMANTGSFWHMNGEQLPW